MKKFVKYSVLASSIVLLSTSAVQAKNSGIPNGQPFQNLYTLIEENRDMILTNQGDIEALETSVTELQNLVSLLDGNIADLEERVTANTDLLEDTRASLDILENVTADQAAEIAGLASAHQADMAALNTEIADIRDQIASLIDLTTTLSHDLTAKIDQLNDAVESNSMAIDGLLLQVINLNSKLALINSRVNGFGANISYINNILSTHANLLADIEFRLSAVEQATTSHADITFEALNTGCSYNNYNSYNSRPFNWYVNGDLAATASSDTNQCSCYGTITTATAYDVELLLGQENTLRFTTPSQSGYYSSSHFSWTRAVINYDNGFTRTVCIYDYNGGNCDITNLCNAGYNSNIAIDQTVNF